MEKATSVNKALEGAILLKEPLKIHESMRYFLHATKVGRGTPWTCDTGIISFIFFKITTISCMIENITKEL
ncbi:unnamed protein product [Cuscuta campestris]|uniref:Uncharacterized protein n=1 Tax=Cuscuta campestris TaxID=132261 RepID=A0A484MKY7_9ASTE|nr:unnamed protein product [Cuscuta campestris]